MNWISTDSIFVCLMIWVVAKKLKVDNRAKHQHCNFGMLTNALDHRSLNTQSLFFRTGFLNQLLLQVFHSRKTFSVPGGRIRCRKLWNPVCPWSDESTLGVCVSVRSLLKPPEALHIFCPSGGKTAVFRQYVKSRAGRALGHFISVKSTVTQKKTIYSSVRKDTGVNM